ncbi:MAG: DUF2924 domain-containing protein [Chloroflexi bacterium]|nr:DUF2924 domain-containing protein [Chloroflexota bacterium]
MGLNVAKEVAAMGRMTVPELRARYAEVFGEECRSRHKQLLVKRIAWRLQALTGGDLSERARSVPNGMDGHGRGGNGYCVTRIRPEFRTS